MSIDVKVTRNDMTGPFISPWVVTVTVQYGEGAAMQYCKLNDVIPTPEDVGWVVKSLYKSIMEEDPNA